MISAATHSLSTDLASAQQLFRAQLEQKNKSLAEDTSITNKLPDISNPIETKPPSGDDARIDPAVIMAKSEERRDTARNTALFINGINQQNKIADIYLNGLSDNTDKSTSNSISPAKAYTASMNYSRRMDLISAFGSVGQDDADRPHLSILV